MLKIKPINRVKDPRTMQVVDRVMMVPKSAYWMRRIKDGDVEIVQDAPKELKYVPVSQEIKEEVKESKPRRSRRSSKEGNE
jgi:hypothetical protein